MLATAANPGPEPIGPRVKALYCRGQRLVLTAMADAERIDWLELQVLAAREVIAAMDLARAGKEDDLRQVATLLVTAEYSLCRRATGWSLDQVAAVTQEERQAIVAAQDELNQVANYAGIMAPFAASKWLEGLNGQ